MLRAIGDQGFTKIGERLRVKILDSLILMCLKLLLAGLNDENKFRNEDKVWVHLISEK